MEHKMALLRVFNDEPNLEPVVVVSGPDQHGYVTLNRIVHGEDGPTDRWQASRLYAFSGDLMDKVNTLATRAQDAKSAAIQLLSAEGTLLYTDDDLMLHQLQNLDPSIQQ